MLQPVKPVVEEVVDEEERQRLPGAVEKTVDLDEAERAGNGGAQTVDHERRQPRQQQQVDELVDEEILDVERRRRERLVALGRASAFDEREAQEDEQELRHVDREAAKELEHDGARQSGAKA